MRASDAHPPAASAREVKLDMAVEPTFRQMSGYFVGAPVGGVAAAGGVAPVGSCDPYF